MANKQTLTVLRKNYNLCEVNQEYPSTSKESFIPRHLSTSEKIIKTCQCHHVHQLSNIVITGQQDKNSKHVQEQTEVIELFHCKPDEEKSSRQRRYRRNDDDERDNTN